MNKNIVKVSRALISVSDKTDLEQFAFELIDLGVEIVATEKTLEELKKSNIKATPVSKITNFPEMMDGRVKTLHPLIHAGILGDREKHEKEAIKHDVQWIDLVICNLYPFQEVIKKNNVSSEEIINAIDVGGPCMIRAAAKNFEWCSPVVDTMDYAAIINALRTKGGLDFDLRQILAAKAFAYTASYDAIIAAYFQPNFMPNILTLAYQKKTELRYGENPNQIAGLYSSVLPNVSFQSALDEKYNCISFINAIKLQGKKLSYNNIMDGDAAVTCVREFSNPACVIVKHNNPCGVSESDSINNAFYQAWQADSKSAFGGIIAINRKCTKEIAEHIVNSFFEIIVAPDYENDALVLFLKKPNIRVLSLPISLVGSSPMNVKQVGGGILLQKAQQHFINKNNVLVVTEKIPTDEQFGDLFFGWNVVKYVTSNAAVIAKNKTTVGIGIGQVSRVDAVDIAIRKARENVVASVIASDGFFTFHDNVHMLAEAGVRSIIQPGGSIHDNEIIKACNDFGISMVFTNIRVFSH